jgi:hypothetical protein
VELKKLPHRFIFMINADIQINREAFESSKEKLHRKIDEEFAELANQTFETIRQLYRKLETLGLANIQEGENLVARKKKTV